MHIVRRSRQPAQPAPAHPPRPHLLPTGGLPSSWLGKFRAIDTVEFLDLSNNFLGQDADGNLLPREAWCPSEAAAGMGPGAGFCPTAAPLAGTAKAMKELNLANNGLSGEQGRPKGRGSRHFTGAPCTGRSSASFAAVSHSTRSPVGHLPDCTTPSPLPSPLPP